MLQTVAKSAEESDKLTVAASPRFRHDFSQISIHPSPAAAIQTKLAIDQPGDVYEQEADCISEQVMNMSAARERTGACGGACPKCLAEQPGQKHGRLRTKHVGPSDLGYTVIPPVVHEVLRSPGQALDLADRVFMEPRFGHDFSRVRVHTDERAVRSAAAVNAAAYTSGDHVVFGKGRYGRALLAHELAHVVQQTESGANEVLQRACSAADKCPKQGEKGTGTAAEFHREVEKEEEPIREELRAKLPAQKPKSGTHGGVAETLTALAHEHVPEDVKLIHGIFVDEALSKRVGALIIPCMAWVQQNLPENTPVPEFEGATHRCVFVSKEYEAEAGDYERGSSTVGGKSRENWLIDLKTYLTHEATHERFLAAEFPFRATGPCSRAVLKGELSEMAAKISEFPHVVKSRQKLQEWFTQQASTHGESLPGTIRAIRCSCDCGPDADSLIRAGFELASASWSEDLKKEFHADMKRGAGKEHDIYWPYELPPRTGEVGRQEVSLLGGAGLTLTDQQAVALLSYRYVLKQWASGRLRLTGGGQANLAGLLSGAPRELGAAVIGVRYISTPKATEEFFGGLIGRIETGAGVGDFRLTPVGGSDPNSVRRGDYILQVGVGVEFFLPGLTSLQPVSLEATYRLAEPIGSEAKGIQSVGLQVGVTF
jgi:Domain of unknown function (DUF4157)